jgi:chloride channel 3/4/5
LFSKNLQYNDVEFKFFFKWSNWNEIFQVESPNSDWWVTYIIHISLSLLLAFLAAVLVKFFAPYACGSGVPEIKTILSGYVMNGYLGKWTLLVKSVGMILATSAGLTLGKEGPMVNSIQNLFFSNFYLEKKFFF